MRKHENVMKLLKYNFIQHNHNLRCSNLRNIFFGGGGGGGRGMFGGTRIANMSNFWIKLKFFHRLRFPTFHSDCCSVCTVPKSALIIMISFFRLEVRT